MIARLPWIEDQRRAGERALSEGDESDADTGTEATDEDAVLLFVGGPLDGRVEVRAARHGEPPATVTHVHLHEGPKVVHRYDLQPLPGQTGVYHVRPRTGARTDDEGTGTAADDAGPDRAPDDAGPDVAPDD